MDIPTIILPDIVDIDTVEIPLPTADIPYYKPMVVPPNDLRDQEDEPVKTVEETPEPPTLKILKYYIIIRNYENVIYI